MTEPLTFSDVRDLKQQGDLGLFIKQHMDEARRVAAYRRGLVLRYSELAAKLTEYPISFAKPEQWNGFIPPATTCTGAMNTARCRPALLALVAEAEQRDAQPKKTAAEVKAA